MTDSLTFAVDTYGDVLLQTSDYRSMFRMTWDEAEEFCKWFLAQRLPSYPVIEGEPE